MSIASLVGVPTPDQLKGVVDDALGKAQSAGITLEDHAGDVIHANLVDALATLFADVKQVEDPLLEQFKRTNDSLQSIALDFTRISQGIVIKFGLQAGTVPAGPTN